MSPPFVGQGTRTVVLDWKTSGTVVAVVSKLSVPVWPSRSGRLPKVIEIDGPSPVVGHTPAAWTEKKPPVGNVVVGPDVVLPGCVVVVLDGAVVVDPGCVVVVVLDVVVVGATVVVVLEVVVVGGWVVEVLEVVVDEGDVVVVEEEVVDEVLDVDDVVVVPPLGMHSEMSGSGPPSSKAMTSERPCASANSSPT
jgi:hypothetical protein